ncbi:MAG: translocation/assembly module TamB [Bacteroidales bacterium OttesenSCG-928-I14]|jgi:hypothetical protein|nr:translocation/assembly module TamB [Bacteroidales bacterium OttesenSCG-928-I14]
MVKHKVCKYIILFNLLFWVIFYFLPIIYVYSFQKELSGVLSKYLEKQIEAEITVDKVEFHFFDKLSLRNVNMKDKEGEILFSAKKIDINFDFLVFFRNKISINSAQICDFALSLTRNSIGGHLNIQFFLNFLKKKKNQSSETDVVVKNFFLKNGNFSYKVKDKKSVLNKFNINDIQLRNITSTIQLFELSNSTLKVDIKQLNFIEKSGFKLKQFSTNLVINRNNMMINRVELTFPRSHVLFTRIAANYKNLKNFFSKKTSFNFQIEPSRISLEDIRFFLPAFFNFQNQLKIRGKFSGSLENFRLKKLMIEENNKFVINTDIKIQNICNLNRANIQASVKNSYVSSSVLQEVMIFLDLKSTCFPPLIKKLGKIFFNVGISGNLNNLVTNINLRTNVGQLQANIRLKKNTFWVLCGKILTPGINIQKLVSNNNYGSVVKLIINFSSTFNSHWKDCKGKIFMYVKELGFNHSYFNYKNICLFGVFTSNSFSGVLKIKSTNGCIVTKGSILFNSANFRCNFLVNGFDIAFTKLYPTVKCRNFKLSFVADINLVGNYSNCYIGNAVFHKLIFVFDNGLYSLSPIYVGIVNKKNEKRLLLNSKIINGEINGLLSIKRLMWTMQRFFSFYIPSLVAQKQFYLKKENINFKLNLTISNSQILFNFLKLPVIANKLHINGEYSGLYNKLYLNVKCSCLSVYNYTIENLVMNLDNKNNYICINLNGIVSLKNENCKFFASSNFRIRNNSIYSTINWVNDDNVHYSNELSFVTNFLVKKTNPIIFIQINPSELFINDSFWKIAPSCILYDQITNNINIDHFIVKSDSKTITVNGNVSKNKNDELYISFKEIDIGRILNLFYNKKYNFGGVASGYVIMKDVFCCCQLFANINIQHLVFEDFIVGNLLLDCQWNKKKQGVIIKGKIVNGKNNYINIDGIVSTVKENSSIYFDMHNVKINSLNKLFSGIFSDFSGQLTGKLHFFYNFNKPAIEGNVWINNCLFKVECINTYYTFSGWIKCTPSEISIRNTCFYDKYKNKAIIDLFIKHDVFKNFRITANLSYKNLLILNTDDVFDNNSFFYGNVFATGVATLSGYKRLLLIKALFHNDEHTIFTINYAKKRNVADYDFVIFSKKRKNEDNLINKQKNKISSNYEVNVDLIANINNKAILEILTNHISCNKTSVIGHGNLQIQYGTKTPLKVFGKYTIEKGKYGNFMQHKSISKKIMIEEGSSVFFHGEPFVSDLNIKANCFTTVNIQDLVGDKINQFSNVYNNIPVNFIFLLSGQLKSPNITFNIEFPGMTNVLEKKIKDCISINGMNWKMFYLFVMSDFDQFLKYAKKKTNLSNNFSVVTSVFFSQLFNTFLKIGNDKFRIGVKYNIDEIESKNDTKMLLSLYSKHLNNHLIINTDFIYVYDPAHLNYLKNSSLIKDCDIEYRFTKSGNFSLKGFNRYNYYTVPYSSGYTQGIGIFFQKNF